MPRLLWVSGYTENKIFFFVRFASFWQEQHLPMADTSSIKPTATAPPVDTSKWPLLLKVLHWREYRSTTPILTCRSFDRTMINSMSVLVTILPFPVVVHLWSVLLTTMFVMVLLTLTRWVQDKRKKHHLARILTCHLACQPFLSRSCRLDPSHLACRENWSQWYSWSQGYRLFDCLHWSCHSSCKVPTRCW